MWKILFITFFTTLLSLTAIAQEKETEGDEDTYMNKYDFTYSHGAFLPFGIVGVRDKYAIDTISFSHPFWIDHLEWTFGYFNSKDVILAQGTIAFRFRKKLDGLVDIYGGFGLDTTYYKPHILGIDDSPYVLSIGGDGNFGTFVKITEAFQLRGSFKYTVGPSHSLIAGIGFTYAFGGGDSKDEK